MPQKARSEETPSSSPRQTASSPASEIDPSQFAEFMLELLQNQELVNEFNKYRHDPKSYDVRAARTATGAVISEMFTAPLNDRTRDFIHRLKSINGNLKSIDDKTDRSVALLQQLVEDRFAIEQVVFDGQAQDRYKTEFPVEKRSIARHIADTFFKSPLHCFLQASTTAFHLVEELHNRRIGRGSVIHTNSFALPYMLLGKSNEKASPFSVYPVSGDLKDHMCDGWLYHARDRTADEYFRGLFKRQHFPIQTAFITPQYVDICGTCYFSKEETVVMFGAVLDMAEEIHILTPGPRILANREPLRKKEADHSAAGLLYSDIELRRSDRTTSLNWIIGGSLDHLEEPARKEFDATCERLRSKCTLV